MARKGIFVTWLSAAAFALLPTVAGAAVTAPTTKTPAPASTKVAATEPSGTTLTATQPTPATATSGAKFYGMLDLRPGYNAKAGSSLAENTLEVGAYINKDLRLTYTQWWNMDLHESGQSGLYAHDGFVRLKANNLWVSDDKTSNFAIQGRLFVPTYKAKRDAGMIVAPRVYFTYQHHFSKFLSMDISEAPQFHAYDKASFAGKANPIYTNLILLNADLHLAKNLTLSLPFYFFNSKMRESGGVRGTWAHDLVFWPELDYDLSANHTIGVAFYTDGLLDKNFSSLNVGDGFQNGVFQLIYTLTL